MEPIQASSNLKIAYDRVGMSEILIKACDYLSLDPISKYKNESEFFKTALNQTRDFGEYFNFLLDKIKNDNYYSNVLNLIISISTDKFLRDKYTDLEYYKMEENLKNIINPICKILYFSNKSDCDNLKIALENDFGAGSNLQYGLKHMQMYERLISNNGHYIFLVKMHGEEHEEQSELPCPYNLPE